MKKRLIPILIISVILLNSCAAKPQPQNPGQDDIDYGMPDTSGMNSVSIVTKSGIVPIMYIKNGNVPLTDENYYFDIRSLIESDNAIKQKSFTYFDISGRNIGSVSYDNMGTNKIKPKPYEAIITSGNWKLCPDMRYECYADMKTSQDGGYSDFITSSFSEAFADKKPNITDIWEYDIDLDGTNEAVVRAMDEGYTVLALLSQSLGNMILASDFESDGKYVAQPYFVDTDANGKFSLMLLSGGTVKTVKMFAENTLKPQFTVYLPLDS